MTDIFHFRSVYRDSGLREMDICPVPIKPVKSFQNTVSILIQRNDQKSQKKTVYLRLPIFRFLMRLTLTNWKITLIYIIPLFNADEDTLL